MGGGKYEKTLYATVLLCTIQRTLPCECLLLVRMTKSAIRATKTILNSDSRKKAFTAHSQLVSYCLYPPAPPPKNRSRCSISDVGLVLYSCCVSKNESYYFFTHFILLHLLSVIPTPPLQPNPNPPSPNFVAILCLFPWVYSSCIPVLLKPSAEKNLKP